MASWSWMAWMVLYNRTTKCSLDLDHFRSNFHFFSLVNETDKQQPNLRSRVVKFGRMVALVTSGTIGLPKAKSDSDPIKKRQTR